MMTAKKIVTFSAAALFFYFALQYNAAFAKFYFALQNIAAFTKKIPAATHGKTHRDREFTADLQRAFQPVFRSSKPRRRNKALRFVFRTFCAEQPRAAAISFVVSWRKK